jgi:adenosyl cobinamide kinase/adenosyl cobinamide phosphate guanylyltransferase
MKHLILQKILEKKNILLVGPTDSGKSHFIKKQMIPLLKQNNINVSYFEECKDLEADDQSDVCIVDEVEILFDRAFLENRHPKERPFYTDAYLKKVKVWQKKLSLIKKTIICVVTRNDVAEINNLSKNYKKLEWNDLPVEVVKFYKP